MAVDTRDKRASALQVQMPTVQLFPSPTGSLATLEKRQFMANLYAGELSPPVLFMGFVDIDTAFVAVSNTNASIATSSAVATLQA